MVTSRFFGRPRPMRLADIASLTGSRLRRGSGEEAVTGVAPLNLAGAGDLTFLDNPKYAKHLDGLSATACLCTPRFADKVPAEVAVLESEEPYRAYAQAVAAFFPDAMRPNGFYGSDERGRAGNVHPFARLEESVEVEPGAVVGAGVEIGRGTMVGAGAVIAKNVAIGRDCAIGANATIQHALIGDRVIIHPGAQIGQDGFGFALGRERHRKVAQVGRVIVQDDVEIGANTTIDRGANRDTVIGEGTKIDNQVQIGHNVEIGRHCIIVAQVGIAGSARLGDFVAIGGQAGINGHIVIGDGAQIAAVSVVHGDVPAGARYGGAPARPMAEWLREFASAGKPAQKTSITDD